MRVLLFVGLLSYDDFRELMLGLEIDVAGVFVHESKGVLDWNPQRTGLKTWTRREFMETGAHAERTPYHDRYEEVLACVLADTRSFYLMERLFGTGGSRTVFNHTLRIEIVVWNSLTILFQTQPDRIVCTNTPHDITWFFARVAEIMGVDVFLTAITPLPWRVWTVKGLDEQTPVQVADTGDTQKEETLAIGEFIAKVRSSYVVAMPGYERKRLERYRGRFFNIGIEIRSALSSRSPRTFFMRLYSSAKKRALLRDYDRFSRGYSTPEKYVVLFLHFQPERTTLPDGYRYAQQWLAIRSLADALPKEWVLVIREHPSTFRGAFAPSVRDGQLYKAIRDLPNGRLAPLDVTPFDLIDGAKAVATITGTVGVEALIRGKPIIVFGAAQYRGAKGVFPVKSIAEIRAAIQKLDAGHAMPTDRQLLEYFQWVERNSFPKKERINGAIEALRRALTYRQTYGDANSHASEREVV